MEVVMAAHRVAAATSAVVGATLEVVGAIPVAAVAIRVVVDITNALRSCVTAWQVDVKRSEQQRREGRA
jgi:hypothetical protein